MQTVILYRYKRADGGYSVSPNRPEGEYETRVRLIADISKHQGRVDWEQAAGEMDMVILRNGIMLC